MHRDNQQITQYQYAWLAGIWDGEGTFQIYRNTRKNGVFYIGRCTLANTSIEMINEIAKIFDANNIGCHLWLEEKRKANHRACYHLTVNKLDSVQKATELMMPYLIAKKSHAELLLRFIGSRKEYKRQVIRNDRGQIVGQKAQGYSEDEISCYDQLKLLNKRGISSTTR